MAVQIDQWDSCYNYYSSGPVKLGIVPHHKYGYSGSPAGMWNANGNVSAHYSIDIDGKKWGHVSIADRAWHTGNSYGNDYLIGIECSNTSIVPPYPVSDATIEALKEMMCDIARTYGWKKLDWHGDKWSGGYVCGHRDLGATACPGDYLYTRLPGIVKDVNVMLGGTVEPIIEQWTPNFRANQQFSFEETSDGYVLVLDAAKGRAMDVSKNIGKPGQPVIAYKRSGAANQQWKLEDLGGGLYRLHSRLDNNLVLDINGGSRSAGAPAIIWPVTGRANQIFARIPAGGNKYFLINQYSLLPLDVQGG